MIYWSIFKIFFVHFLHKEFLDHDKHKDTSYHTRTQFYHNLAYCGGTQVVDLQLAVAELLISLKSLYLLHGICSESRVISPQLCIEFVLVQCDIE